MLAPWDPPDRLSRRSTAAPAARAPACPTTSCRSAARSASAPTARSRTSSPFPDGVTRCAASSAPATSTSSTSTSRRRRSSAGTPARSAALRWSAPSTPTRRSRSRTTSRPCSGRAASSTSSATRIAVSEAAAWTGRRWFGGELRDHPQRRRPRLGPDRAEDPDATSCGSSSSAAPRSARACRSCSRAFAALVEHVPSRLTVIGASTEEVERLLADPEVSQARRRARQGQRHGALAPARRGRRPLRALALGRELRDGPDRGLRGRYPGDRLRDRRLQRRGQRRRRRRPRPAG